MGLVRAARETQRREHVAEATRCSYCSDQGEYELAAILYCARCALRNVVLALRAQVARGSPVLEPSSGVLVDH